ncbi:MAG: alanyl-tRNA editing protein [Bacilli bacterium]|jgi:Ser-tRNA(Ala) deacylase AlaX|nr:alanyl-tRNA editing protein [Bacilli bacterium]
MTKKLYWDDRLLDHCQAQVIFKNNNRIMLDQTIAYAFSGGQESDYGSIGGYPIREAIKKENDIIYDIGNNNLNVGDEVEVKIDIERRKKLIKLHSLGDIVLQIIIKKIPDMDEHRIGAHVSEDKVRIDFNIDFNISSLFPYIQDELKKLREDNLAMEFGFIDESKGIRYWTLPGYPHTPCGGTHIKRTSELNEVILKRKNIGKNKERIEMSFI